MWSWRAVAGVRYTPSEGHEGHFCSFPLFDAISEITDMANTRPIMDGMRPIAPTGKSNRLIVHMPIRERTTQTAHLDLISIFDNNPNMMLRPSSPFHIFFVMAELRLSDELRVDGSKRITHQSNRSVHSWPEGSSSSASVVLKNLQLPIGKSTNNVLFVFL